jgi:hypothetical protein
VAAALFPLSIAFGIQLGAYRGYRHRIGSEAIEQVFRASTAGDRGEARQFLDEMFVQH